MITIDVLIDQLRSQGGWIEYEMRVVARRDRCLRDLLHCRPTTPPEEMHALIGEINGLNFALGTPDKLRQEMTDD